MNQLNQLNFDLQQEIGKFSKNCLELIRLNNPKIKRIVIQPNDGNFYIGQEITGRFIKNFYDSTKANTDLDLINYVMNNSQCFDKLKMEIQRVYPEKRLRSFNVFYYDNGTVYVCQNLIGNKSKDCCKLFETFKY